MDKIAAIAASARLTATAPDDPSYVRIAAPDRA